MAQNLASQNILLLGSGGREHALAHKLRQSPLCASLSIAPGNAGTHEFGNNVNIQVTDFEGIKSFCLNNQITMLVVGPEEPLVRGIYDFFSGDEQLKHIAVIGPSQYAAQLEGSKSFCKAFMQRHNIPTASYAEFTKDNYNDGMAYIQQHSLPVVLKADGLAAGKGVVICNTHAEAIAEFEAMVKDAKFGEASAKVVIEQFLDGIELSVFVLTDGKNYVLLPEAKDYKRIGEGDTGLNTGGMGAISPVPFADKMFMQKVISKIIQPTINGLSEENINYHGFIFFGLIKVNDEPMVIEYNCRLGDPETEAVLPRLDSDLVELFILCNTNQLHLAKVAHLPLHAATVVCVSGGYPQDYEKGFTISNIDCSAQTTIYHAGTKKVEETIVTAGGRVLAITSLADSLYKALALSKECAERIDYKGKYYRKDIGYEFI